VKVTASKELTFANIAAECTDCKGIAIAGIVDCASPRVIADIDRLIAHGELEELPDGGLRYRDAVTLIPGAEFETTELDRGQSHHVSYFATVAQLKDFSALLSQYVTNIDLSSQACRMPAADLLRICDSVGGTFVPAHSFTPHKSAYGSCTRRLERMFPGAALDSIPAIELGLSADAELADRIGELHSKTLVTNSDAHSLPKIGREYNTIEMQGASFAEVAMALRREGGRRVTANYGLDPRLGKYHRTVCEDCEWKALTEPPVLVCQVCGSVRVTVGVLDRIVQIQDRPQPQHPPHRPPYHYQVPLAFVPNVGPVTLNRLINQFGSEMAVLHEASADALRQTVGARIADLILLARSGELPLLPGGGGEYGKAVVAAEEFQLRLL
jgi:uncharacterized protein (TIGR00375 family)